MDDINITKNSFGGNFCDKHISLFGPFVNYGHKKFHNTAPGMVHSQGTFKQLNPSDPPWTWHFKKLSSNEPRDPYSLKAVETL